MEPNETREERIFGDALKQDSPAARSAYLDHACAGDPQLRARIEVLLRAHERASDFLAPRSVEPNGSPEEAGVTEAPGTVIGRYTILEQIGEGGMGTVFLAEQREPLRRQVALKVIKLGMDTRAVIARFDLERQVLALMDHPNVAKVLDAGATDTGRPFFVMELVRGEPITKYSEHHRLNIRQRLELFIRVCQAVPHAHQKGIIHRDLKPSNVLVVQQDSSEPAVPKVIDFGVAKAMPPAMHKPR